MRPSACGGIDLALSLQPTFAASVCNECVVFGTGAGTLTKCTSGWGQRFWQRGYFSTNQRAVRRLVYWQNRIAPHDIHKRRLWGARAALDGERGCAMSRSCNPDLPDSGYGVRATLVASVELASHPEGGFQSRLALGKAKELTLTNLY